MTETAAANRILPDDAAAADAAAAPVETHAAHAIVVDVAADNALAARLIHPRAEVAAALRVAIEKGAEIRARRIRYQEDLDDARLAKLKWTQASIDLLTALFDNSSVADYCNDWVGKIFPEYADIGNFVEQFYEEMEHRLGKLRSVLGRVEQVVETPPAPIMTQPPESAPAAPPVIVAAPAPAVRPAARVTTVPVAPSVAPTVAPTVAPDVAPAAARPAVQPTPPAVAAAPTSHVMLFGAAATDAAYGVVAALLERLGVGAHPTSDPLAAGTTDAAVFVAPSRLSDPAAVRVALFQLGCAVGRLGADRVCVLHPAGAAPFPESAVAHIPADAGGGWQLQLARQLKQAGLNVDLNKLF